MRSSEVGHQMSEGNVCVLGGAGGGECWAAIKNALGSRALIRIQSQRESYLENVWEKATKDDANACAGCS